MADVMVHAGKASTKRLRQEDWDEIWESMGCTPCLKKKKKNQSQTQQANKETQIVQDQEKGLSRSQESPGFVVCYL